MSTDQVRQFVRACSGSGRFKVEWINDTSCMFMFTFYCLTQLDLGWQAKFMIQGWIRLIVDQTIVNLDFFNENEAQKALDKLTAESLAGSYRSLTELRPTKSVNGVQLSVRIAFKTDAKEVCSAKITICVCG